MKPLQSRSSDSPASAVAKQEGYKLLFVCMGNICRSPSAEGVFRQVMKTESSDHIALVDSAGTHAYHIGDPPDARSIAAAERRHIDISRLRARQVADDDFETFDLIVAMDRYNLDCLAEMCPKEHHHKLRLLLDFAEGTSESEVPDPYYGGPDGFETVLNLLENACRGLLADTQSQPASSAQ
jgi:protein-tyrosine phosphatase